MMHSPAWRNTPTDRIIMQQRHAYALLTACVAGALCVLAFVFLPNKQLQQYSQLAQRVATSVPWGAGPEPGTYRTFDDAVRISSAHCGHYADMLQQELAAIDITAHIVDLHAPLKWIAHSVVEVDDYVIDPMLGIVCPHSLGELLSHPERAASYIGEVPKGLEGYAGERFFAAIENIQRASIPGTVARGYVQNKATIRLRQGGEAQEELDRLIDGTLVNPVSEHAAATIFSHEGDADFELTWKRPVQAARLAIVPDWTHSALPRSLAVTTFLKGEPVQHIHRPKVKMRSGNLGITLRANQPFDRMDIALTGVDGTLQLREFYINGWEVE